jgi:hypothetical protein
MLAKGSISEKRTANKRQRPAYWGTLSTPSRRPESPVAQRLDARLVEPSCSDRKARIPPGSSTIGLWMDCLDACPASRQDPRDNRVRVPHFARVELVAAPHRCLYRPPGPERPPPRRSGGSPGPVWAAKASTTSANQLREGLRTHLATRPTRNHAARAILSGSSCGLTCGVQILPSPIELGQCRSGLIGSYQSTNTLQVDQSPPTMVEIRSMAKCIRPVHSRIRINMPRTPP